MKRCVPLEEAALEVVRENSKPPLIFQLPPKKGREVLDRAQDSPVYKYPAGILTLTADTGEWGKVKVYVVIPQKYRDPADVIFYIHGAGWVFGNFHTHEKLVRELAARTESIVVFPEYSLSPEAKYPKAVEQCYALICAVCEIVSECGLKMNLNTFTVAGDSVGGSMAAVMTIMSKMRSGPYIQKQLLYYPVTCACFDTKSYEEFACGCYLYRAGMKWFWDQYTSNETQRREITASPLRARTRQLEGLPAAMIINGEADVLRDEGQAYSKKLRLAGVDVTAVCIQGTIHDFVMLNALNDTNACRTAMDISTEWIKRRNLM